LLSVLQFSWGGLQGSEKGRVNVWGCGAADGVRLVDARRPCCRSILRVDAMPVLNVCSEDAPTLRSSLSAAAFSSASVTRMTFSMAFNIASSSSSSSFNTTSPASSSSASIIGVSSSGNSRFIVVSGAASTLSASFLTATGLYVIPRTNSEVSSNTSPPEPSRSASPPSTLTGSLMEGSSERACSSATDKVSDQ
jgi:hypothetical protein